MRKTARENAFKLIYEGLINPDGNKISYKLFSSSMNEDDKAFFDTVIDGVAKNYILLESTISRFARGYKLERIYKIDFAILLVASFEILFLSSIPDKVSANEAVETAKKYSTDNSPAFINGIIAAIIKDKENILNDLSESN